MKARKVLAGALALSVMVMAVPETGVLAAAYNSEDNADHGKWDATRYTEEAPFKFPSLNGTVATVLEGERATVLHNVDNSGTGDNGWQLAAKNNQGKDGVFSICKGDYAQYAYTADIGTYLAKMDYYSGGDNYMDLSETNGKIQSITDERIPSARNSGAQTTWWDTHDFNITVATAGAGMLKIAPSASRSKDGPSFDRIAIFAKYSENTPFEFPTATDETKKLEAECGIITDVTNSADENGRYKAQETQDTGGWTENGWFVNSINTGDSLRFSYNAAKVGTYEFEARYRSGGTNNQYTWSETNGKIKAGSIVAGKEEGDENLPVHTKKFKVVVKEKGAGTLTFAAPSDDNTAMTDVFKVTLVVDKTELLNAITDAAVYKDNLDAYIDGSEKKEFEAALENANAVSVNYEDDLEQEEVDAAVTRLTESEKALVPIAVTGIEVTSQPTKKIYNKGDSFESEGLVVKATKNNNDTVEITEYVLSELDSSETGEKTLTVTYNVGSEQYNVTFSVLVVDGAALDSAITVATAKKTDGNRYLATTFSELEKELSAAETVQNDIKAANGEEGAVASGTEVTQERVAEATKNLNDAVDNLEKLCKVSVPAGVTITAENTEADDAGNSFVYVEIGKKVTISAPEISGEKTFTGWKWNDNVISTSAKYTLYAVEDMELTPSYEANEKAEEVKQMFTKTYKNGKHCFIAKRSVPKTYQVSEYGVVITDETGWNYYKNHEKEFKKGATRTKWTCKAGTTNNGTFEARLSGNKSTKYYAKAYVTYTYEDAEGTHEVTKFTDGFLY